MKITSYVLGLMTVLLIACSGKEKVPKKVLQPEKMKEVMWDLMQVQNLSKEMAYNDSVLTPAVETKVLSNKVFEIYKIDSATFARSYEWYLKHPVMMKKIMDSLYIQKQRKQAEERSEAPALEEVQNTEEDF